MPVTNYYTIDGQMVGYKDTAGARKDFLQDALGSVTAEVDQTGNTKTFSGRYQPYGGTLSTTGSKGLFGWVGTRGYRETGLSASSHYIRARHYSKTSGTWTTIDPLWPRHGTYGYAGERVTASIDSSGLAPCFNVDKDCAKFGAPYDKYEKQVRNSCDMLVNCYKENSCNHKLRKCFTKHKCWPGLLEDMIKKCDGTHCVDIWCCKKNCCGGLFGSGCDGGPYALTYKGTNLKNCGIGLCPDFDELSESRKNSIFLHEISHCSGTPDWDTEDDKSFEDCHGLSIEKCFEEIL
jgi:RHS repeat-associated protein